MADRGIYGLRLANVSNAPPKLQGPHPEALRNVLTLDTVLSSSNITHIDLLHIKVNGAEVLVLQGAQTFLRAGRARCVVIDYDGEEAIQYFRGK